MAEVELRPITRDNWITASILRVAESQRFFVGSNDNSMAMAAYEPNLYPTGVYNADSVMVGFIMYGYWEEMKAWWIARVMVDERYQGQGYGRAAIEKVIELVKEKGATEIGLSYDRANSGALHLYESLGFSPTGEVLGDEIVLRKPLS